jgi:hypothetical protein
MYPVGFSKLENKDRRRRPSVPHKSKYRYEQKIDKFVDTTKLSDTKLNQTKLNYCGTKWREENAIKDILLS